jgi:hypothetical protein
VLKESGVNIAQIFGATTEKMGIAFSQVDHPLVNEIKFFWRDKGDALSKQYTGTGSTISKVSQDGKEGFFGKLTHKVTSLNRIIKNTIYENTDQESIDVILGKHGQQLLDQEMSLAEQFHVNKVLTEQESLFTSLDFLKISISTWNMGGVEPLTDTELTKWLFPFGD